MAAQVVSYVRVSTAKQGISGLGLDGQRAAIEAYCKKHGVTVAKEFREVESGTRSDRAVLAQAIAHAKRLRAKLVIGKLDRLARNVHFISGLMEAGIDFAACDLPEANRFLLHIMASVAEAEAKATSERTIAALTAAKARGKKLGACNPKSKNLSALEMQRGRKLAAKAITAKAKAFYADVHPIIHDLRSEGRSLANVAAELNQQGFRTRNGSNWGAVQISRAIEKGAAKKCAASLRESKH